MHFSETEKYILAMIGVGMLQAGVEEGIISRSQFDVHVGNICSQLGTSSSILTRRYNVEPFQTIRQMSEDKKMFVKTFLFNILQQVKNCQQATYYFVHTLEEGELMKYI